MWAKSITDFKEEISKFYNKYGEFIDERNETIANEVVYLQSRYLLNLSKGKEITFKETDEIIEIDRLDKEILQILSENARTPLIDIAEKLKVSPKVIAYRIKKLEKQGVIEGYRVNIDHKKLGFIWHKLWINSKKRSKELIDAIKRKFSE